MMDQAIDKVGAKVFTKFLPVKLNAFIWNISKDIYDKMYILYMRNYIAKQE